MKKIKGNFDSRIAETYGNLIDKINAGEADLEIDGGGRCAVFFTGSHVIKHAYESDSKIFNQRLKGLTKEYEIGKGLEELGINVPKMHFVGINDSEIPFLVMDRLNLTHYSNLSREKKVEATKQYARQMQEAMFNGYKSGDTNSHTNCGFDLKQNKLYFFDFGDWRKNEK